MAKSAKQLLKSYGKKISAKELKNFQDAGYSTQRAKSYVQKKSDVKFKPGAFGSGSSGGSSDPWGGGGTTNTDPMAGYWAQVAESNERIADITGGYNVQVATIGANATTAAANIRGEADKYIADAYSGAQRYGSELALEGTKYSADKEAQWRQAVAQIETKGRLDLQPIINAGLEKVANIEAQASRDVADITGKYNVEGIKTRGEFDEKIGKLNLAGSMYGLISTAFG